MRDEFKSLGFYAIQNVSLTDQYYSVPLPM